MREGSPDLKIGTTLANFSSDGNIPSDITSLFSRSVVSAFLSKSRFLHQKITNVKDYNP